MNSYSITTPEKLTIHFELIQGEKLKALVDSKKNKQLPESDPVVDILRRKAFLLEDGKVIQLIAPFSGQGLLFDSENDYIKANRSEAYYATTIIIDNDGVIHYNFNLDNAAAYYNKAIKKLEQFPEYEGYQAYLLPEGRVCFLRQFTETRYQGYWYPDIQSFEYFYKQNTNESTHPKSKTI